MFLLPSFLYLPVVIWGLVFMILFLHSYELTLSPLLGFYQMERK